MKTAFVLLWALLLWAVVWVVGSFLYVFIDSLMRVTVIAVVKLIGSLL